MKKLILLLLLCLSFLCRASVAQYSVTSEVEHKKTTLKYVLVPNYPPISYVSDRGDTLSVFDKALDGFARAGNYELEQKKASDYKNLLQLIRRGNVDIVVGDYFDAEREFYEAFIYPAVLNNPIHVLALPQNIDKIQTLDDLKNLRGVYAQTEFLSNYMINNFKRYGIKSVETPLKAYEMLFIGEADYVIGSYYYNYIQTLLSGLKNSIAFSKGALWNMPLFIGVSKASLNAKRIKGHLEKYVVRDIFKNDLEQALKEYVSQIEIQSQSIVPPMFVKSQGADDITPADEKGLK